MNSLLSEIKKPLYWGITWVFTFINFATFIVSRNEFLLTHPGQAWLAASATEDRTYLASEFERNLSCHYPLTCIMRSGGAFLSQAFIEVIAALSNLVSVELNMEQKTFIILLVGLMWRVLCLALFLICVTKLLESLRSALCVTNCLMFVLGGLPLWTIGKVIVNLPIGLDDEITMRVNDAFYFMSYQNLIFYDYGFIAIVPLTMLALAKIDDISKLSIKSLFLIGFLSATFFEAFVPIIFLSALIFLWRTSRKVQLSLVWLIVGQLIWATLRTFSVRFTEANDPASQIFTDTSLFGIFRNSASTGASTKGSLVSILIQLCFIGAVAITAGVFGSVVIGKFRSLPILTDKTFCAVTTTAFVTTIIIFSSFLRPIYVETGRQSVGLTVSVVIYSFAVTQNFLAKDRAKRMLTSANTV